MQTRYSTKNVPAAILLFIAVLLNILVRFINYQAMGGSFGIGIGFARYALLQPTSIIWWLGYIAAGVMLLAKLKPGVGVGFFVIAAVCIIWLANILRFFYGPMVIVNSFLPQLLELVAFAIAGIICVASAKVPRSGAFVALPSILYFAIIVFSLIGCIQGIISILDGYGNSLTFAVLRLFVVLAFDVCVALALLFACQWAMSDRLDAGKPLPAIGGNTYPNESAQQVAWFCPNCGTKNSGSFCGGCGRQIPERIAGQLTASRANANLQQTGADLNRGGAGQPATYGQNNPLDTGSFGWAVLGFLVPLVGLILWIVWKSDRPMTAKKAGMGALVSVLLSVVLTIIEIIVIVVIGSSAMYY